MRDSYYRSLVGRRLRVLAESQDDGRWVGTSCRYATVELPAGVGSEGQFVDAIAGRYLWRADRRPLNSGRLFGQFRRPV